MYTAQEPSRRGTSDVVVRRVPGLLPLGPAVHRVLATVRDAGGRPFVVGGSVRDALLARGTPPKDLDVEVFGLDVGRLHAAVRDLGWAEVVGAVFPVVKMHVDGLDLDLALPASPHVVDGAGPVEHDVLREAARRRDYTINALLLDPVSEEVVDLVGGLDDLEARVLRHTSGHFGDDPLRVLRGVQLAARLGLTMAPETVTICSRLSDSYPDLPRERVWEEWRKLAAHATRPSAGIEVLVRTGWERHHPQLAVLHDVEQDPGWHPEGDVHVHSCLAADRAAELCDEAGVGGEDRVVVVLAALLHDVGKATHTQRRTRADGSVRITSHGHDVAGVDPALRFLADVGAPARVMRAVGPLVREHMRATGVPRPSATAVRRLVRALHPATFEQWALVCTADKGGRGSGSTDPGLDRWREHHEREGPRMTPVLQGRHLVAAGLAPGPWFGELLAQALDAQDAGEFTDLDGALAWLAARREDH